MKTIRETVNINPLYRETLSRIMMMAGPSSSQGGVFDNPVAIADLAAALTTASSEELQRVLEERDVSNFQLSEKRKIFDFTLLRRRNCYVRIFGVRSFIVARFDPSWPNLFFSVLNLFDF